MRVKRPQVPQNQRSSEVISWRIKPEIFTLLQEAARIRGWAVERILETGGVNYALEICQDAMRSLAKVRVANRRARSRQGGLAKASRRRNT